jgi:predicted oxidoreductase (fatty acid repression mutant protein)
MKKTSTKRVPRKEIKIKVGPKPTIADVERAIEEALANKPTDFYRNSENVVVIIANEGGRPGPFRGPRKPK